MTVSPLSPVACGEMESGYLQLVSQIRLSYIKLNIVGAIDRLTLRAPIARFMVVVKRRGAAVPCYDG